MSFSQYKKSSHSKRNYLLVLFLVIFIALIAVVAVIRISYNNNLRPVSNSQTSHVVTVETGSTPSEIGAELYSRGVIRSEWAFEWYVRNHQLGDKLQAGTYVLYENQHVEEIVQVLMSGKVATDLVTILPGKRLDQVRAELVKDGFSEGDVDAALEPSQYADNPALTDKPEGASLEGYLFPESFQKTASTSARQIVEQSLDEMQRNLTQERRESYAKQGLTVHQAVIIASIVEQEVSNDADRSKVAQVFLKRYKEDISLGSDPTAFYATALAGVEKSVFFDSPYNTRLYKGLPPGPIGNVSEGSLEAVAHPAQTDWLFFVAGDDGTTHFSKTQEEHEALTKQYCTKLCQ
jgi:UPF0755 protein